MSRRRARERALGALFAIDVGQTEPGVALEQACSEDPLGEEDRTFCRAVALGAWDARAQIDAIVARLSNEWRLERMAPLVRNVLRLAVYEIFFRDDVPATVSLSEAVELAKRYADPESARFVNGVLAEIYRLATTEHPSR